MTALVNFVFATDDKVVQNESYHVVKWPGPGKIFGSYVRRGEALTVHFSSDKKGLRHIKQAINDFCEWAFHMFEWCKMIIALIEKPSVIRLVEKCGFKKVAVFKKGSAYARCRIWD